MQAASGHENAITPVWANVSFESLYVYMNASETDPIRGSTPEIGDPQGRLLPLELRDAAQVGDKLVLAVKNLSFYPDNHAIASQSVKEAYAMLASFVDQYGSFVVGVEKTHFHYRGRNVFRNSERHRELAYKCYRDGIQFLAFADNIRHDDYESFIKIVSRRSLLEDSTEGDIVTDLWEARLGGVKYSINEELLEKEALLDLSSLSVSGKTPEKRAPTADAAIREDDNGVIEIDEKVARLWELSPEELAVTRQMVNDENQRTFDQDVFDVFLVILGEQRNREDFSSVLTVIIECFKRTLSRCEFSLVDRFMLNFNNIYERFRLGNHWALSLLDDFLMMVSSPRILGSLPGCLNKLSDRDTDTLRDLESMLKRLSPESIVSMGPMTLRISSATIRNHVNRAIMHHASKDSRPLYMLAKSDYPAVAGKAIMMLSRLGKTDHIPIIMECAGSDDVFLRRASVKALTMIEPPPYKHILPFILDEDATVQEAVGHFLALKSDGGAENAIMEFIRTRQFSPEHINQVAMLYKALGRAASSLALDFMVKQLFGSPWRLGKLRSIHRQGAVAGLLQHPGEKGAMAVRKAQRSPWPTIRRSCANISSGQGTDES